MNLSRLDHHDWLRAANAGASDLPDERYGGTILAICTTMTILAFVTVVMRCYVRLCVVRAAGRDDILMVVAMILNISTLALIAGQVHYGAGRHAIYIVADNPSHLVNGLRLNFISQPVSLTAITTIKIAVAVSMLRLGPSKKYLIFIWTMIIFMCIYTVVAIITVFLQCTPMRGIWDSSVPTVCFKRTTLLILSYFNQALVILSDLVFAVLPPIMLRKVQLSPRVKFALFCITSLGVLYDPPTLAAIASLIKTSFIANYGKTGDFLFDSRDLSIWSTMEMTVGIIAGSIPCLRPLFRKLLRGSSFTSHHESKHTRDTKGYTTPGQTLDSRRPKGFSLAAKNTPINDELQDLDLYTKNDVAAGVVVSSHGRVKTIELEEWSDDGSLPISAGKTGILKTTTIEIKSHSADSDDYRSTREIV